MGESASVNQVYATLQYMIEKAAQSGKLHKATLRIPYLELKEKLEVEDFEYQDLDLQVFICLKWVESDNV